MNIVAVFQDPHTYLPGLNLPLLQHSLLITPLLRSLLIPMLPLSLLRHRLLLPLRLTHILFLSLSRLLLRLIMLKSKTRNAVVAVVVLILAQLVANLLQRVLG